jgi:site-specific DNA-methyltransferase (adenine-specific)
MSHTLHLGDCLDVLRTLPDCSVHAVVTDPPYGLAFMGKRWDYDVPSVAVWAECLRVLKPGGHLLAFAGTRTQHRMAVRIEDAGFEIRDMIAWVYGSGFPKSLDVSKAIDKLDAAEAQQARRYRFTEWVRSTGLTSRQIDDATGTNMGGHYTTAASQPAIMTMEHLDAVRRLIGEVPEWVERECEIRSVESENFKAREVVGQRTTGVGTGNGSTPIMGDGNRDITAPATAEAQQWQGWGTALKPALEPITMARKPLTGTVAANVLEHGTGALNVDGCRVWTDDGQDRSRPPRTPNAILGGGKGTNLTASEHNFLGRWPANLIHDGSDEVVGLFPQTTSGANPTRRGGMGYHGAEGQEQCHAPRGQDTGSAARFFYTAKASASERQGVAHPTVKPLDLMAYLCRLVTPPGGVVLDPFMGSGTTIKAAIGEGFQAIGIERDPAYFEMAQHRMDGAQLGLTLPAAAPPAPQSRTD